MRGGIGRRGTEDRLGPIGRRTTDNGRERVEGAIRQGRVKNLAPAEARDRGLLDRSKDLDAARRAVSDAQDDLQLRKRRS